jgi:predicted transposase YdaD
MKRDDALWKAILEDLFDDFLMFFYVNAGEIFDLSRGFEFLDKELEELSHQEERPNRRYVDKLVKVFLKNGMELWILIHIEVQGYSDPKFEERMFTYYYRIRDKYQQELIAWAILTDSNKNYHPTEYKSEFFGTSIVYKFNTYKILDQDEEELKASANPFAVIVLTALLELKKNKFDSKELIELKLDLARNLFEKGFSKEKIRNIMNFLRYYVRLKGEDDEIFEEKLDQLTGKNFPMGTEQYLLQKERKEGLVEGIEIGIEKGIEKGIWKKTEEVVISLFKDDFTIEKIAKHSGLNTDQVLDILRKHSLI